MGGGDSGDAGFVGRCVAVSDCRWLWLALLYRTDMDMSLHYARYRWHTRVAWAKVLKALHGVDAQVGGDGGDG